MLIRIVVLICLTVFGCQRKTETGSGGGVDPAIQQQASLSAALFADSIQTYEVYVFYEPGAEPYTGNIGLTANNVWRITLDSLKALFQNHVGRVILVPTTIGQMIAMPAQSKTQWTNSELKTLGRDNAPPYIVGPDARVAVFFLKGSYNGNNDVLGVHLTGQSFVFVFKDVVAATGGDSVSQRYVEQATVVHELGHAAGLVNNGVPMIVPHEDSAHPKHTTNTACVMHWQVESKSNVLTSLASSILGNKLNLFGPESLQDGRNFHP